MNRLPLTRRRVICSMCGKVALLEPGEAPTDPYAGLHTCHRRTEPLPCPVCKGKSVGNGGMCGVCRGAGRFLMPLRLTERDRIEEALNQ